MYFVGMLAVAFETYFLLSVTFSFIITPESSKMKNRESGHYMYYMNVKVSKTEVSKEILFSILQSKLLAKGIKPTSEFSEVFCI
jgi:hypothetical protein